MRSNYCFIQGYNQTIFFICSANHCNLDKNKCSVSIASDNYWFLRIKRSIQFIYFKVELSLQRSSSLQSPVLTLVVVVAMVIMTVPSARCVSAERKCYYACSVEHEARLLECSRYDWCEKTSDGILQLCVHQCEGIKEE